MNIKQSFILALKSLMTSKMRAFLTMLGIIIGVGAVIIIVALINGMTKEVLDQFEQLGATNITVSIFGRGGRGGTSSGGTRNVDIDDMQKVVDDNPEIIKAMTPAITLAGVSVKHGTATTEATSVIGANEFYSEIQNVKVEKGRGIQYFDCQERLQNCVVGTYIANEFFFGTDAIGQTLKINGKTFTVVGVFEEKSKSEEGSADDRIVLPYTTAQRLAGSFQIGSYTFCAVSKETSDQAQQLIERYLYGVFNNESSYMVTNMSSIIDTLNEMTATMSIIGSCVAGVSLLVGGIGIMSQFVVEAITTSCIGGLLGILFGIAGSQGLGMLKIENVNPVVSINSILISFAVSAIIGVAFGYFPAKKAAKLNPIDALRYD